MKDERRRREGARDGGRKEIVGGNECAESVDKEDRYLFFEHIHNEAGSVCVIDYVQVFVGLEFADHSVL